MLMTIALPKPIFVAQNFCRKIPTIWTNSRLICVPACANTIRGKDGDKFLYLFCVLYLNSSARASDTLYKSNAVNVRNVQPPTNWSSKYSRDKSRNWERRTKCVIGFKQRARAERYSRSMGRYKFDIFYPRVRSPWDISRESRWENRRKSSPR